MASGSTALQTQYSAPAGDTYDLSTEDTSTSSGPTGYIDSTGVLPLLETLETRLKLLDARLYGQLQRLDGHIREITEGSPKPKFMAKNGWEHAKRMFVFLAPIEARLKVRLSAVELFVLCSAVYLHDVGMYCYFYMRDYEADKFESAVFEKLEKTQCAYLYNEHANFSEKYIREAHEGKTKVFPDLSQALKSIDSAYYVAAIAGLHKSYWPVAASWTPSGIRMRLLKALLQLADAGDVTNKRAVEKNRKETPDISFDTYWKFLYVDGPVCQEREGLLLCYLSYRIPSDFKAHFESYSRIMEARYQRRPLDCVEVIREYGAPVDVVAGIVDSPVIDDQLVMMPPEVIAVIKERRNAPTWEEKMEEHLRRAGSQEFQTSHELVALEYLKAGEAAAEIPDHNLALRHTEQALQLLDEKARPENRLKALEMAAYLCDVLQLSEKAGTYWGKAVTVASNAVKNDQMKDVRLAALCERESEHLVKTGHHDKAAKAYSALCAGFESKNDFESARNCINLAARSFSSAGDKQGELESLDALARISRDRGNREVLECLEDLLLARIKHYEPNWLGPLDWLGDSSVMQEVFRLCDEISVSDGEAYAMKKKVCGKLITQMTKYGNDDRLSDIRKLQVGLSAQGNWTLRFWGGLTRYGEHIWWVMLASAAVILACACVYALFGWVTVDHRQVDFLHTLIFSCTKFCSMDSTAYRLASYWPAQLLAVIEVICGYIALGLSISVLVQKTSLRSN
ncbi:MAG: hypothetical protein KOO62_10225 [candidate division Zixibacteria bacterium]|nr:hypothetical protein [candidate division Zixibacteria bacterium]